MSIDVSYVKCKMHLVGLRIINQPCKLHGALLVVFPFGYFVTSKNQRIMGNDMGVIKRYMYITKHAYKRNDLKQQSIKDSNH